MIREGSAEWQGSLKEGKGTVSTESVVLANAAYSFGTRFENGKGTNPEEMIAAAHASCFSMALSAQLGAAGITPETVRTTAAVTLEKVEGGFAVTASHLDVTAKIPGADRAAIALAVDATEAPRHILHAKLRIPAAPGELTLYYPKWIPGEHGPTGPIQNVAGITLSAGGRQIEWSRDGEEMYAISCDVPAGAGAVDLSLDYLIPSGTDGLRGTTSATSKL